MQRRLALALALVGDPPALVLDEPTLGLDPLAAQAVWELVARAAAKGRAVCVATHALRDLLAVADRIVVLRAGRVAFAGAPGDVERTAALLGPAEALR